MTILLEWFANLQPENQLKAIALAGAAVAFLLGLLQYRQAQRWKRAEWVAQEMERFFADRAVHAALKMIDWGKRPVELYPNREKFDERYEIVTDDEIAEALKGHDERGAYLPREMAIRDIFDQFLDRLERIYAFIEAGVLRVDDVEPHLRYWAENIIAVSSSDPTKDRIIQLRRFIECYGFIGVQCLFARIVKRQNSALNFRRVTRRRHAWRTAKSRSKNSIQASRR